MHLAAPDFKLDLHFTLGHAQPPLVRHVERDRVVHLHGDHIIVRTQLSQQLQGLLRHPGKVTDDADQGIMPSDADGRAQHVVELPLMLAVRAICAKAVVAAHHGRTKRLYPCAAAQGLDVHHLLIIEHQPAYPVTGLQGNPCRQRRKLCGGDRLEAAL
ncbi:hypothetical protein D3C79_677130 [compost metagenome]